MEKTIVGVGVILLAGLHLLGCARKTNNESDSTNTTSNSGGGPTSGNNNGVWWSASGHIEDAATGVSIPNVAVTLTVSDQGNVWGPKSEDTYTDRNGNYSVTVSMPNWGSGYVGQFTIRAYGHPNYYQDSWEYSSIIGTYRSTGDSVSHNFQLNHR